MSGSRCSNDVGNMKYENVVCVQCGTLGIVRVSKSARNPGRLYYSCHEHRWLKWVVPSKDNHEANSQKIRKRNSLNVEIEVARDRERERHKCGCQMDATMVKTVACKCEGLIWPLVIVSLGLLATNVIVLLILVLRS